MRLFLLIISIICTGVLSPAQATEQFDFTHFKNLPVQHQGRIKPMQSVAQIMLRQLSGQTTLKNMDATQWFAASLFDPNTAALAPVIKISDRQTRAKLGIDKDQKLVSLNDLSSGLQATQNDVQALLEKNQDDLSKSELALLQIHENAATLTQIMRSFSALIPLNVQLPPRYTENFATTPSYIDLIEIEDELTQEVSEIIATKGTDPSQYSPEDLNIAQTGFQLKALSQAGENNQILRILPPADAAQNQWASIWEQVLSNKTSIETPVETEFLISQWSDLVRAYQNADTAQWSAISKDLLEETYLQSNAQIHPTRFALENTYRTIKPYAWIIALYAASLLSALFAIRKEKGRKTLRIIAGTLAILGITAHCTAIGVRVYILDRPPVGTLYESILFVSAITAIIGIWLAKFKTNMIALFVGIASALALLFIAPTLSPSGDSLEVLVAVLNTNFWLTTHVLSITIGYGVCIIAATLAHATLFLRLKNTAAQTLLKLQKSIYHLSIIALVFTLIGTSLGGIWADQSWGRFWGWDPKENGALLIVLWLIWAQHGRASSKLSPIGFMSIIAALNMIVALSWFGINLLNVGLHSYGFTSGLAGWLFAFCAIETAIIAWLYLANKQKERKA